MFISENLRVSDPQKLTSPLTGMGKDAGEITELYWMPLCRDGTYQ
jgi:hypothetical protein